MKTEIQIKESIEKVKASLSHTLRTLNDEIGNSEWGDASETLFTLIANVSALEAAERILK